MLPLGAIKPAGMQATVFETGVRNREGMDPCGRCASGTVEFARAFTAHCVLSNRVDNPAPIPVCHRVKNHFVVAEGVQKSGTLGTCCPTTDTEVEATMSLLAL
jgi:hypothetical protein